MDVTEISEPTPSFSHLLGLLLEAITAYLLLEPRSFLSYPVHLLISAGAPFPPIIFA
ncbi:hypothetical protein CSPX01_13319 [Colletotrichum filicis]|nr:hypothetical protein CSPX01_13319 [Colletotrichum filicis]